MKPNSMNVVENNIPMRDGIFLRARVSFCDEGHLGVPWLIITHGIAEHFERHNYMLNLFGEYFNIVQYDLRGHGKSSGDRAWVQDFSDYAKDLLDLLTFLKVQYGMKEFTLFGHSMGGTITALFVKKFCVSLSDLKLQKVFLSSPLAGVGGGLGHIFSCLPSSLLESLARSSFISKKMTVKMLSKLSHDPLVFEKYRNDPLVCKELSWGLLLGMIANAKEVFSSTLNLDCPLYCAVGAGDTIVSPTELEHFFGEIETGKNVHFQKIQGAFHELHNETLPYRKVYFEFLTNALIRSDA